MKCEHERERQIKGVNFCGTCGLQLHKKGSYFGLLRYLEDPPGGNGALVSDYVSHQTWAWWIEWVKEQISVSQDDHPEQDGPVSADTARLCEELKRAKAGSIP